MASITIQQSHGNLIFAASVSCETNATFEENGQWITIADAPELTIPRYCFDEAFDPQRTRSARGDSQLENAWRALLLNKCGYLVRFDDMEIVLSDEKPRDKRPQFLLRFGSDVDKAEAERWASCAHFDSLTDYILAAVRAFNEFWAQQNA